MMLPRRGMCRLLAVQPVCRGRGSSLQLLLLLLLLLLVLVLLSLPLHDLLLLLSMRRRLSDVLLPLHLQVMRVWYSVAGGSRRRVRHVVLFVEVGVGRLRRVSGGGAQRQVVPVARSGRGDGSGGGSHGAARAGGVHRARVPAACAEVGEVVRRWQAVVPGGGSGSGCHGGRLLSPTSGLWTLGRGGRRRRRADRLGILDRRDCGGMLPGVPGGGRRRGCHAAGERLVLVRAGRRRRRSLAAGGLVHLLTLM